MTFRELCIVAVALAAAGCSAASDGAGSEGIGEHDYGGQTGSLIPSCGDSPALDQALPVPAGDGAFVVYADQCVGVLGASDISLTDTSGNAIPFALEPVSSGAFLVRATEALVPGEYRVTTPGVEAPLVVVEPEPVPQSLGRATVDRSGGCRVLINLNVAPEMRPYLPLLRLDVSIDDGPPEEWFAYGELELSDGYAYLNLGGCEPTCLEEGPHRITLSAHIAGEMLQPDPIVLDAEVDCSTPRTSSRAGGAETIEEGCTLTPRAPSGRSTVAITAMLLALFGGARRIRRR